MLNCVEVARLLFRRTDHALESARKLLSCLQVEELESLAGQMDKWVAIMDTARGEFLRIAREIEEVDRVASSR